jgi:dephospho-CoA kinase
MRLIGLTGGIGTGKSTVGRMIAAAGVPVIDADDLGHAATAVGGPAYAPVIAAFGAGILAPDGTIDRRALGAIVFADAEARARLNAIVHPAVRQMMFDQFETWQATGESLAVTIIPLLYESGLDGLFDEVWVASCPEGMQRQRVQTRDGFDADQATARIAAQMPLVEKVAMADHVIDTSGTLAEVESQVTRLLAAAKEPP